MVAAPTLELDAGFEAGGGFAYYDAGFTYDDGSVYGPVTATNISAYGRDEQGIQINRGVSSIITQAFTANAGVLTATLDNRDRRFDPNHLSGPYVEGGVSKVVPGVPIIAKTAYNSITYTLFTGMADEWPQQYPNIGTDQVIDLRATDGTQLFAGASLNITRSAEQSGARIQAVLDAIGYSGPSAISTGNATVAALANSTVSAWSHMQDVANAEWGDLYFSANGTLTFRSRDLIFSESRSVTSQATFGDAGTELRYSDVQMGSPPIVNDVTITYSDTGSQVTSANLTSQNKPWGKKSLTLALPLASSSVAQQYADWIIARYAYPVTTFASITIAPQRGSGVTSGLNNLLPQAFGRELGDRITVKRTPQGGGSRLSKDCFVRGISHTYADHVWKRTVFTLQDASFTSTLARYDVSTYDGGDIYSL